MNVIIPMAGIGKRMRPHTLTVPKPLIPVANKPIVQRLVEDILATCSEKVENIGFIIGDFGTEVEADLMSIAETLGAKGHIFHQKEALGTAHAIYCAEPLLSGHVFVAFADTLFKANFDIDIEKDGIIWCQRVEDPSAFGVVTTDEDGLIDKFVEKPQEFVSDLAIIGVYYFRSGDELRAQIKYLLDNNITDKGEFQLTDAMENMKQKGDKFYVGEVEEWLDCGNKENTLHTNERILEIKQNSEELISPNITLQNSVIIPPCAIADDVMIKDSVIGPHVSVGKGTKITDSVIKDSMVQSNAEIKEASIRHSMIGNFSRILGDAKVLNLGDYNTDGE